MMLNFVWVFFPFLKHSFAPKKSISFWIYGTILLFEVHDIAFWVLSLWEVTAFAMKKDVYQNFSLA